MLFQKLSQSIVKNELLLSFLKSRASFSQVLFSFLIAKAICGAASLHTFIGCCPLTLLKRLLASNYTITYVFLYYLQEILETHVILQIGRKSDWNLTFPALYVKLPNVLTGWYKKQIEFSVFIIRKLFTRSNNNFPISLLQIFINFLTNHIVLKNINKQYLFCNQITYLLLSRRICESSFEIWTLIWWTSYSSKILDLYYLLNNVRS